jgi:hypothetical protein
LIGFAIESPFGVSAKISISGSPTLSLTGMARDDESPYNLGLKEDVQYCSFCHVPLAELETVALGSVVAGSIGRQRRFVASAMPPRGNRDTPARPGPYPR